MEAKTPFVGERLFLFSPCISTSLFPFSPFPIRICRFHLELTWKEKARNRWKPPFFADKKRMWPYYYREFQMAFYSPAISNVGPDSRSNTLSLKFQFPPVHVDFPRLCKQVHYWSRGHRSPDPKRSISRKFSTGKNTFVGSKEKWVHDFDASPSIDFKGPSRNLPLFFLFPQDFDGRESLRPSSPIKCVLLVAHQRGAPFRFSLEPLSQRSLLAPLFYHTQFGAITTCEKSPLSRLFSIEVFIAIEFLSLGTFTQ